MAQEWICNNEEETANAAQEIAAILPYPCIVCLTGQLGAGKTAFSRALIRHLTNEPDLSVPSPTYTLVQMYDDENIWHFDLYRLDDANDIYDLGWEEALTAKICLIEWPIRLKSLKPKKTVDISIDVLPNEARRIRINP